MSQSATRDMTVLMAALLPAPVFGLLRQVEAFASTPTYLVGGTVRDLLLGLVGPDLDIVVEGDGLPLGEALAATLGGELLHHPSFGTTRVTLHAPLWQPPHDHPNHNRPLVYLDIATARAEHYARPGALPTVTPGADLVMDLRRRDFTTNAVAIALNASRFGQITDPFAGQEDLAAGRLNVLHPDSFLDDPTRLLRGLRLAGRLGLRFAPECDALIGQAVHHGYLGLVSAERRRHELLLLLEEPTTSLARALALARHYGLAEQIHPAIGWDEWLAVRLVRSVPWDVSVPLAERRLGLLAYRWPLTTIESFIGRLRPATQTQAWLETLPYWQLERRDQLASAGRASEIAAALADLPVPALAAVRLAEDDPGLLAKLDQYVQTIAKLAPRLTGRALQHLDLPPGPAYRPILAALRQAVLDGELPDEASEWEFLRRQVAAFRQQSSVPC